MITKWTFNKYTLTEAFFGWKGHNPHLVGMVCCFDTVSFLTSPTWASQKSGERLLSPNLQVDYSGDHEVSINHRGTAGFSAWPLLLFNIYLYICYWDHPGCVCVCVCVFFRKTGMSKPETGSAAYIKSNHLIDFVLQFCYTVRYQYVSVDRSKVLNKL